MQVIAAIQIKWYYIVWKIVKILQSDSTYRFL